jgi:hypothetical protein
VEEISRQPSIQAVVWALLAAFTQIYSGNKEQKAEWKDLEKLVAVLPEKKCI